MDCVRAAAVQLISESLDVARAVEEACEQSQPLHAAPLLQGDSLLPCDRDVVQLLQIQAASSSLPAALLATKHVCAVLGNCWRNSGCQHILDSEEKARLARVVTLASHLQDSLLFLPQYFLHFVTECVQRVPLEALLRLHSAGLLSLETLLQETPAAAGSLVSAVLGVSTVPSEEEQQEQQRLMQAVAHFLVELTSQHRSSLAAEVVRQLAGAILAHPFLATYSLVEAVRDCPLVTSSEAIDLTSLLLRSSLMEPQMSLVDAFPQQEQWKFTALPPPVASFYGHISSALDGSLCLQLLQRAITVEKLNWPALLQFVACFLNTNQDASGKIKDLIQSLLISAMSDCDLHQLSCGLLLARQSSLEGSHLFPSYPQWFQATFGGGVDSVVSGKKQLLFLLKCLTKLAPHEPIFALKAHIAHPPHRLAKCHSQLTDYTALASTRLQDLGEKVPILGCNGEERRDSARDVCDAVEYFKTNRRISQTVMEASIFRQPYFVGQFLPALLMPAVGLHERQELIEALDREKKIPSRMLRNYEKGCDELRSKGSTHTLSPPLSCASMAGALRELTLAAGQGKSSSTVTKILSRLSSLFQEELGSCGGADHLGRRVQLVDNLLSAVCEAVALQANRVDTGWRWISNLLSMLAAHANLHWPIYLRLKELLTTQLSEMTPPQLMAVAVLLCELFCLSPPLHSVEEDQESLKTGQDYCLSLLTSLSHNTGICMTQSLRFGCMFVHHLMSHDDMKCPVPHCLLKKMVYIYRREQFLRLSDPHWNQSSRHHQLMEDVVEAVDTLLSSQPFTSQWNTCQMKFQEWLSWELKLDPSSDSMSRHCRRSYQRHMVFGQFLQAYSLQQLFEDTFQYLVQHPMSVGYTDGLSLLQELCNSLPVQAEKEPSSLLRMLQGILATDRDAVEVAMECVVLASSLPPYLLFTNHLGQPGGQDHVAAFVQNTLVPLVSDGMALPLHLTHYLWQGVMLLGGDSHSLLCTACPAYLSSVVAHWPHLRCLAKDNVPAAGLASWIHSGMCSHPTLSFPLSSGPLMPALAVGVFQYLRHGVGGGGLLEKLALLPPEAVVLVAECCVRKLAPLSAFSSLDACNATTGSDVQALLQACLLQESSAVEVFHTEQDQMDFKHKELLASTRSHFPCTPSTLLLYHVLLLKLLPGLAPSLLQHLMKESCFMYLCVTAHRHCLQLNTQLPLHPPAPSLVYQPLSAQFMQDCATALTKVIHLASKTQLEGILEHCHAHLKPLVSAKLHRTM